MAKGALDFRLLGTMEVCRNGAVLALGGAKQRALLAILLINANCVVTTDELVESLWSEKAPGKPLTAIQGYVSALRRILDADDPFAVIVTEPAGYRIPVGPGALDTMRFEEFARNGRVALDAGEPRRAVEAFADAVALFRGPPLADFMYESWATTEKARLDELRLVCVEDRVDGELQLGRHAELIGELESLVSENPLRERLRGQLMLALYRSGRQAEALEAYQESRRILVDELGIEPSTAIKELHAQILNQDASLSAPEREPTVQATVKLPAAVTTFVGRTRELADVVTLLGEARRVVTLSGPGGTGKTRLALEAARQVAGDFEDGTYWIPLANLRDPSLVLETIRSVLGTSEGVAEHISDRKMLLVLDNLEQVIDAAADLSSLIQTCHNLTVLATSREVLRIQGEVEYAVPPLEADDAVSLFCDRSRLEPSQEIDELCQRLDSLPLALELAAGRSRSLTPGQMAERLSRRLDLFQGGRDSDPRQQTLRATMEWSYDLLPVNERNLAAGLSIFSGGCTPESAEAVCGADLDALQSLVEKSLLRFSPSGRYWMLETIREFAKERLAETGAAEKVAHEHAEWHASLAERHAQLPDLALRVELLANDRDNFREALAWALSHDEDVLGIRLTIALADYWRIRADFREARLWLETWLDRETAAPPDHVSMLEFASTIAVRQGDQEAVVRLARAEIEAASAIQDEERVVRALVKLSWAALFRGDLDECAQLTEEAIRHARAVGDQRGLVFALTGQGNLELEKGDTAAARQAFSEVIELVKESAEGWQANLPAVFNMAVLEIFAEEFDEAARWLGEALRLAQDLGNVEMVGYGVGLAASVTASRSDFDTTAHLLGSSAALIDSVGASLEPVEAVLRTRAETIARRDLGSDRFDESYRAGRAIDASSAAMLALKALEHRAISATT